MLSRSKSNPASQQRINDSFLLNFLLCPVDPDNEGIQKHRTRISRISNTQRCPGLGGYSENGASEARNTAEEKSEESVTRCEMSQIILPTDDIDPADVYFTKRNTFVEILWNPARKEVPLIRNRLCFRSIFWEYIEKEFGVILGFGKRWNFVGAMFLRGCVEEQNRKVFLFFFLIQSIIQISALNLRTPEIRQTSNQMAHSLSPKPLTRGSFSLCENLTKTKVLEAFSLRINHKKKGPWTSRWFEHSGRSVGAVIQVRHVFRLPKWILYRQHTSQNSSVSSRVPTTLS